MRYNTKIVYKKPIAAILFSVIMVLSIFSGVALADNSDRSNEIPPDFQNRKSSSVVQDTLPIVSNPLSEISLDVKASSYYATKAEAVSHVPTHVTPKDCFVWKDGPDPTPWRVIPGTGCAHWVAHELGLGVFPSPWQKWESGEIEPPLPAEAWQVCYDGFYIRVADVIAGRSEVEIKDAKVGDIWTNDGLTHCGIVRQVGDDNVLVEHCSSAQGGVVQTWFSSGKCWSGISLDLIFTIDTTGSMWDDIAYVKTSASAIADEILSDIPTARIAVVDYRDFPVSPYGGAGDYPFNDVLAFSTDKPTIVAAIQGLTLGWGNDWRESVYSGLMHSIDPTSLGGWRGSDQAAKVIILMGDAPPHDPEPFTGYTLSSVVTAAYNADPVIIYPIQIGGSVEKFEELADQTGGKAFTAANAGEVVDAILEAIGEIKTKPVAVANGPYSGYVGSPITFDGTGSYDLDGMIVSYEWDLDDDGEFDDATGPTPSKTWSTIYSGTISLLVTDDDGEIDTDSTTLTVEEAFDTEPPAIVSVTLDAYTTIPDATIHVTVEATDNVGVSSVTAGGVDLVDVTPVAIALRHLFEIGSIWEGDITAPSATGSYTLTIQAEDEAGNFDETTLDYSVVIPTGGLGVGIQPKISSAAEGSTLPLDIKIVSTANFDDVLHVYLTLDGIPPDYQADLSWFDWTDKTVQIPTGGEVILPITVDIPGGTSQGYKSFGVKVESTKWSSDAQDYGAISVYVP